MIFVLVSQEVLQQRRSLPVLRIVALDSFRERDRHRPVEEWILAIHFFAASPARIARQIRLRTPVHQNLAIVLRCLGDVACFESFDATRLADQVRIPGVAHARRLRKLCSGDGLASEALLALHHAVNPFRAADVGHAEARHARACSKTVDLLLGRHQRQQIVDALVFRQTGIVEGILRLLRKGWAESNHPGTEQDCKSLLCHFRDPVSAVLVSGGADDLTPGNNAVSKPARLSRSQDALRAWRR